MIFTQKRTQPLVSSELSKSLPSHRDSDSCLLSESVKTGLEQEKEGRERKTDRNVERD